jgi:transposase-like protein
VAHARLSTTAVVDVYLDALYPRVRCAGRVRSLSVLVALGVAPEGDTIVLALQISGAETGASWAELVTDLANRGLRPPELIISDGNRGLAQALTRVWPGVAHQRCVVHKQRNVVSAAPRHVQGAVRDSVHAVIHAATLEAAQRAREAFVRPGGNGPRAQSPVCWKRRMTCSRFTGFRAVSIARCAARM